MKIVKDQKLDFKDVMICPKIGKVNSRSEVSLERTFTFRHSPKKLTCVPIIASNMDTVGTIEMARALQKHKMITALHKFVDKQPHSSAIIDAIAKGLDPYYLAYTTGIRSEDFHRLNHFKDNLADKINIIIIDVPNGYIPNFFSGCKKIREMFPEHIIMAGNIVTHDVAEKLLTDCKVDVVKVGIGPGAACETRKMTGVGYPQLSAVIDISQNFDSFSATVVSDGGCRTPGDVAKAFAAGADFVMLGSMLSGHTECGNVVTDAFGTQTVEFRGMSSKDVMNTYYNGVESYKTSEGITIKVPHKGLVDNTVLEILGGLRSTCTYVGVKSLDKLSDNTTFVLTK